MGNPQTLATLGTQAHAKIILVCNIDFDSVFLSYLPPYPLAHAKITQATHAPQTVLCTVI